jgi:predicted membrane metal-binding protein
MLPGIFRLLLADLRSNWFQAVAALLLIGAGIIGVAYFTTQAQQTQLQVQAAYQEEGAASFVMELSGISDEEVDRIVAAVRQLKDVGSADVPYNGLELGVQADASRSVTILSLPNGSSAKSELEEPTLQPCFSFSWRSEPVDCRY